MVTEVVAPDSRQSVPPIRTFVIGIELGANLDTIVVPGGDGQAWRMEAGAGTATLVDTLLDITTRGLAGEYAIPEGPRGAISNRFGPYPPEVQA